MKLQGNVIEFIRILYSKKPYPNYMIMDMHVMFTIYLYLGPYVY